MGKNDIYMKSYLSDKARFADLFNNTIGQGKEIFTADNVREINGASEIVVKDKEGKELGIHRYRDVIMESQSGETLILLAVENQEEIHYAMPIRSMLYDAINYSEQVSAIARGNRESKMLKGGSEYLSGFRKIDRVRPVITLIFYYGGSQEWDGSKDIYGLLDMGKFDLENFREYIPNYHMNLVQAKDLAENNSFKTDLQCMLGMLQYKESKKELIQYVNMHKDFFGNLDANEFGAAKALLGGKNILKSLEKSEEEEGGIDMCKALDDWYQDGVNEGMERGMERGEARFRQLCLRLLESGSKKDLEQVFRDEEYCQELYKRYQL